MLPNSSALPVPGPCARRMMVPSSMFQSTSAAISWSSPCALSAAIQPRRSPKAVGLRSTDMSSFRVCNIALTLEFEPRGSSVESLRRRRDLGDEVANERLVGQRRQRHLARLEARGAGIDRLAVELHQALLAGIGIDAGEADRERGIAVRPDPAQTVEHGLAGLERDVVALPPPGAGGFAAPHLEARDGAHCAAAAVAAGTAASARPPAPSRAIWLTRHSGSMPGKSSRWWAPRLSPRASAAMATVCATVSMLRRSNHSRK